MAEERIAAAATHRTAWPRGGSWALLGLALLGAVTAAVGVHLRLQRARLEYRLLLSLPDAAAADPALVRFAAQQAKPLFAEHCARCHGADMRGKPALGAPNLTDRVWLWGDGSVYSIERTILYGIRSGLSEARDTDDMPPFGMKGAFAYHGVAGHQGAVVAGPTLDAGQVRDLVQYLLKLNHRPYQVEAANEGERLFYATRTSCYDCHGPDARGISDYGAPNLTINVWSNGGDPQSLFDSIYFGRRRMMPGWRGTLSLTQIRALAVYIYSVSHPKSGTAAARTLRLRTLQ